MSKKINIKGPIITNASKWIYNWFGWDSCCPKDIQDALEEAAGEDVVIEINSNGGITTSGFEIYTALKEYKGNVEAHVISAMSAATIIACGADKVLASDASIYMIHNTQCMAEGDYRDMQMEADALREYNASIINVYEKKTGLTREKLQELMDHDTHMSTGKAIELGFVDGYLFGEKDEGGSRAEDFVVVNATEQIITEKKAKELMAMINGPLNRAVNDGEGQTPEEAVSDSDTASSGSDKKNKKEGGSSNMTLEEFLAENPEARADVDVMVLSAKESGALEERARLKELDEIAKSVAEGDLRKAKYGETPMNAKELSFETLKKDAAKAESYMQHARDDSKSSGVEDVGAVPEQEEDREEVEADAAATYINKLRGRK